MTRRPTRKTPWRPALLLAVAILSGGATVPASTLSGPRPLRFERLRLPAPAGEQVRVGAVAFDGTHWWLAGSTFRPVTTRSPTLHDALGNAESEHRPALWRSDDGRAWSPVATRPVTGYGRLSELYALAVTAGRVVAVGAATGGAHGNPRIVSWVLGADGVLAEVPAPFELYNGPRQLSVRSVVASPAGWVIFGSRVNRNGAAGATAWTSRTGRDFAIHDRDVALSSASREQVLGMDVARQDDRLLAVGERWWVQRTPTGSVADTDAIAWASATGETWTRWVPAGTDLGGPGLQRAQRIGAANGRTVIGGTETNGRVGVVAWTSAPPSGWMRTRIDALGGSDDVLSAVTDAEVVGSGFVVAARLGDRLVAARSADGRRWSVLALPPELPTGRRASLSVAGADGILVFGARSESGGGAWRATEAA